MATQNNNLEELIRISLEEAKKKAKAKKREEEGEEEEGEEEEEEEEEESSKKRRKMEEARREEEEEEEEESSKKPRRRRKMEEARREEEEEEEEEEEGGRRKRKSKQKMEEETLAASSLHPAARAVKGDAKALDASKVGMMANMMHMMSAMSKEDLNHFAATMAQFGPNHDHGVKDNSAHNAASIKMKPSHAPGGSWDVKMPMPRLNVKEDMDSLFEGQDLSEDFKENVATLFEAAVSARIIAETVRLEETYEAKIQEDLSVFQEELTTKIDAYLDYVVERWMSDNQVAIESALRNEIMEEFIYGLKNLFAEHYIDVPEQKVDVLEALAEKVNALEEKLDETITENTELKGVLAESHAKSIFENLASDLALTQQEKFAALVEGIEFDGNFETYEKKLKIVKENYFKNDNSYSTNFEEETFEGDVGSPVSIDPQVGRYLTAITRTVKK